MASLRDVLVLMAIHRAMSEQIQEDQRRFREFVKNYTPPVTEPLCLSYYPEELQCPVSLTLP